MGGNSIAGPVIGPGEFFDWSGTQRPLQSGGNGLAIGSVFEFMTAAERADVSARRRSLDVTAALQNALETVSGTISFPPGDYLVSPGPEGHALFVRDRSISLVGDNAQIYFPSRGNHQALRMERCTNSSLRGMRFRGAGVDGANGDRGMVQIYLGSDFTAEDCAFNDAVCDGLAVAAVLGVTIRRCSSHNASKAAIYVNNSRRVKVERCQISSFGGHRSRQSIVGAGLQLSGNTDLVAEGNIIRDGTGVGLLCNNSGKSIPHYNRIVRNIVENVANPGNPDLSSGIRLTNEANDKATSTGVFGNTVRRCALYNYYFENQDGCQITNNVGIESLESNFVFSSLDGAVVSNNSALNSNVKNRLGQVAYYLINNSRNVVGNGNRAISNEGFDETSDPNSVMDNTGNLNRIRVVQ
jgi:hypothetical protein